MSLNRAFQTLKTSLLLGGIVGFGFGCIISLEPIEPCDSGSNNKLNDEGECECLIGYDWCTDDPADLNCCDDDIGDDDTSSDDEVGTTTGDGDTDTTGDGDTDTTTGDGDTTTGDGDGGTGTLPPDDCAPEEEGFFWCTHDADMGPQGSQLFICSGGAWVEDTVTGDETCQFNGFDFSYGCVDNGVEIQFECGDGSGADCDADAAYCVDDTVISECVWGKETHTDCQYLCDTVGIEGVTYEYGECDDIDPDDVACYCCDSDDPDCPING
ncbi:hypothetical protein PPSIR1_27768 [Plesiocystis pacifica SIR-1]|uniref:Lipoprotein n=1 Tax=Plesiocystis pacifica SIR-1 TaxID=391625 RepID=A6GI69_9BACT|nr:hypothetical protein [Plesiocystis pacifica]EDM74413.1 hypothetical protein PPSIR1_27768 [Plesiocystis pacifica SIR-1]